ncbi:MAG: alpha/beta hydrolase [Caulobacteraceae bacterium]|nr:alpha/beta hydrolase [Caulobacteraceae bacterium]
MTLPRPTPVPEEDRPTRLDPDLAPEVASPLAPFDGRAPEAPAWFHAALAQAPERTRVPVEGADIELLTWGEIGRPGLIFVHGASAHADWWSFIAPFFAATHRVAALSLSGMGGSDWRPAYSFPLYAEEIHACAEAAGLYAAPTPPVSIGHSFGGGLVFHCAATHPDWMRAAILVDTGFGGPPTPEERARIDAADRAAGRPARSWGGLPRMGAVNRVYPTLETALTRFRFMPPQVPGNLYIADHIARLSLRRAPMPNGAGEGWTWKFDPEIWAKLDRSQMIPRAGEAVTPMVHIYGDRSAIVLRHQEMGRGADTLLDTVVGIVIPDSEHHVMVDQPLALVAAIRALLAAWPPASA